MSAELNGGDSNKAEIERIIDKYPLHEETFASRKPGQYVVAEISRDDKGKIIFVLPGSVKAIFAESEEIPI